MTTANVICFLRLAIQNGVWGCFGQNMAGFDPKLHSFGRAPPNLAPTPQTATGKLGTQTLDLGKPHVNAKDGQSKVEPNTWTRVMAQLEKRHACCCGCY